MFLAPTSLTRSLTGLAALVLAAPAVAQVTITCDPAVVTSRVPCVLTASHGDGKPRAWKWSVVGLDDASRLLEPLGPDRVRVRTPVTLVERSFTVVAEDSQNPSVTGTFVLRITPSPQAGSGERALAEGLFPGAFTPSLVPFLGHPEKLVPPHQAHRDVIYKIAFCDDAVMGALDRCWVLAKGSGLEAYKVAGDPVAIPGFPLPKHGHRLCVAVATLPPGPGAVPAGAPRVVFCEVEQHAGEITGHWIYALEADGRKRFLAGGAGAVSQRDGPGQDARFVQVTSLALDRGGNVYICDYYRSIRRIGLDGQVSTVWLFGSGGALRLPRCCTVDPATGDLYVGGADSVVKFTPEGKPIQVIGGANRALASNRGHDLAPLMPGRVPLDTRFDLWPGSMAIHGRELFLATRDGICAFHLDTRRLARIVPMDPDLKANRLGPLHYLNPHLPASRCATLKEVGALALTKEAMGLVVVGQGVAELELPDDPVTSIMDPPNSRPLALASAGAAETKESRQAAPPDGSPEPDNLWPGQALETGTVRADGQWGAYHWRSAAPDQRFSGQCRVEAQGLSRGWAQIRLLFTDGHGKALGHSEPAGPGMPDVVSAPAHGRTLIHMTGTAPQGADRVALCLRVVKGNSGAVVTFHDVTFHQLP